MVLAFYNLQRFICQGKKVCAPKQNDRFAIIIVFGLYKRKFNSFTFNALHKDKFCRRLSGTSLSFISFLSSLVKGNLYESLFFFTALDSFLTFSTQGQSYHIYPTPPLGQDMTQGQFLSGV